MTIISQFFKRIHMPGRGGLHPGRPPRWNRRRKKRFIKNMRRPFGRPRR